MNLILLFHDDLLTHERARITGRRLRHVLEVHRARVGDELAVGLLGGRIGTGRVTRLDERALEMDISLDRDPPAGLPITVILALPRPKVLRRVLFSMTVMGIKRVILVNAARVEKSYWQSPFLQEDSIHRHLVLGLEQARDTMPPGVLFRPLFKPFVEDELSDIARGTLALAAHPSGLESCPRGVAGPVTLAIGPEGGFVPFEIEKFRFLGFSIVHAGVRVLNVETAVSALIARLS